MSKRRKPAEPELPLFDLPLYSESQEGESPPVAESIKEKATAADAPTKKPKPRRRKRPPVEPGPMLFSEEELSAGTALNPPPTTSRAAESPRERTPEATESDESALLQDRLLGGLADLTIHFATLGLMVVAVQLMGVPVSLADWPAFAGLAVIFSFLYAVIPLAFWGHTPGMAWVGHSARSETDEPLSFGQTAMRWAGALFTVLLLGLPLIMVALSGRSLADRLSDSKTLQL